MSIGAITQHGVSSWDLKKRKEGTIRFEKEERENH